MTGCLLPGDLDPILLRLASADRAQGGRDSGDSAVRQPVHVVYGGAHLFRSDMAAKLGKLALRALDTYAPDFGSLARAIGLPGAEAMRGDEAPVPDAERAAHPDLWLAQSVHARVRDKLEREPVEDYRIDFEDGYGYRPDAEEDRHAVAAAREAANALAGRQLPAALGIRVKPLTPEASRRAVRTLDIFVSEFVGATGGRLPENFVVALPKVSSTDEAAAFGEVLGVLEGRLGLDAGSIGAEVMIETPSIVVDREGRCPLPRLVDVLGPRLRAVHLGAFDFTAALQISARDQSLGHPACDFARLIMQCALAGTGVWVSDSVTTVMPVPVHRASADRPPLSAAEEEENRRTVRAAWKVHHDHVRRALAQGIYQGWDLHPAQLVPRYAALFAFFLGDLDAAATRLRNFVDVAAQATRVGAVFDDAASGQGLLNHFLRAIHCGALTEAEVARLTGLDVVDLHGRSFTRILARRRSA